MVELILTDEEQQQIKEQFDFNNIDLKEFVDFFQHFYLIDELIDFIKNHI